MTKKVNRND
ncbi:putative preprotein translocase secA subunit, partial [Chlamydia psittaci 06-1683]